MTEQLPVIKVFRDGHNTVYWCPWCKIFHIHGLPEGYRQTHCICKNSPLQMYEIKYWNKKELLYLKKLIEQMLQDD